MNAGKLLSPLFCVMVFLNNYSLAQLQATIGAKKDNTLYEDTAGLFSNGAGEYFFVGKTNAEKLRRGLIAFDVAGNIPASAIIDSVKLKLSMSQTIADTQRIELHRVLADWGEGTSNASGNEGAGAAATPDEATWIHRFFNTRLWTKAGGDFVTTASASRTVGSFGFYVWGSAPQMVADVQMWLNNPASNFGWLLLGNENKFPTAKRFDSREHSTPVNRPVLTVFYHTTTRVADRKNNSPTTFSLAQNYPNPFNPSTTIRFELPNTAHVTLQILDLAGRELEIFVNGKFSAGEHQAQWNAEKYAGGIYLYRLRFNYQSITKKLILVR